MGNRKYPDLKTNYESLNQRVESALQTSLRNRSGLTVVAVSKRQPLSAVTAAYKEGIRHFGESQVQEGIPKVTAAPDDIHWHFIGHLQRNKARQAVRHFEYIHSIDSLSLLQRVDRVAGEERTCPKIFLQVNLALDPNKFGLHPEAVRPVLDAALAARNLTCLGLMGIPPVDFDDERIAEYFRDLAKMAGELKESHPDWPAQLSMGMSGDFEIAIREGSHFVRVGSYIFGAREV